MSDDRRAQARQLVTLGWKNLNASPPDTQGAQACALLCLALVVVEKMEAGTL